MKNQPLIFSASIGHGHNQAAKALKNEFNKKGFYPEMVDTFHVISPILHHFMLSSYIRLLKLAPFIWRKIYFYAEEYPLFLLLDRFGSLFIEHLYSIMNREACPFIISTHPFVTAFLSRVKQTKQLDFPLYTVITDFVLHPAYIRKEIDGYFTASPKIEEFANLHNVPSHLFNLTGIPISNNECIHISKWKARYDLGLDPGKKTLLIAGGGIGLTNFVHVLQVVEHLKEQIQILCMVGHNHRAKHRILQKKSKHMIKVIEFTDQFLLYLKASDGILSKAGGLTMAEALACETPIIIFNPVPGHEEQNANYLTHAGAAVKVDKCIQLPSVLERVLYEKTYYTNLQYNAQMLKKPNAANQIVDRILTLTNQQQITKSH
ncbi:MGDG synthase family glycosyltransferase [Alteribacillus bidgolensis]|uniref:Monogalactosyldiacylglycerol synthase n=1 Tax=Alteribacillus bidgolensis TaxID=930129 RepID=A0A1G8CV99_9BACI|nr:glycosyltransferase [Alteribacillus bidgolensis]SDH48880.1 Monogalactosyldiacylglycerol synthase [Alteribacillus bidgolensis]